MKLYIFFLILFTISCSSNDNDYKFSMDSTRNDKLLISDTLISNDFKTKNLYNKFKKIMNLTPEGYNIIDKKLIINLTNIDVDFYDDSLIFEASYMDTVMISKYDIAKIQKSKNGKYTYIFVLFTKNGQQTDYLEILNYCENCKDWSYYSLSGLYYNKSLDSIIGVQALVYDTINQGKPIHHGFLKIKDTIRWKIVNGKFIKLER